MSDLEVRPRPGTDTFYAAPELRQQLAFAKGARTQADRNLKYAVAVHAEVIKRLGSVPLHRGGVGRISQTRGVMDRALRRLEAAESLIAAIEDELEWAQ